MLPDFSTLRLSVSSDAHDLILVIGLAAAVRIVARRFLNLKNYW
jgi:hypothetical protein